MLVANTHPSFRLGVYVSQMMIFMLLLALVPPWLQSTPSQAATLLAPASPNATTSFIDDCYSESFNNISTLTPAGWSLQNLSEPGGTTGWFQSSSNAFPGYSNRYIAANYNNTFPSGTISNWLISPSVLLYHGFTISFWTRTSGATAERPDRLEVRVNTTNDSTDVGTTSSSVGDFTTLLLSINPDLTTGVYPKTWTKYNLTVTGLDSPVMGRFAFRYFVTNGGVNGANSNFIGIDELTYGQCEPLINVSNPTLLGQPTQFSSIDFGPNANYSWQFGDGGTGTGLAVQHTYPAPGSYPVTLTLMTSVTIRVITDTAYVIAAAPGGVKDDLSLWLKADAGVTTTPNADTVMQWADQAGFGRDVAQTFSSRRPTYQEYAWNSNPVLNFDTTDFLTRTIVGSELFDPSEASILFAKQTYSGGVWFNWETSNLNRIGFEVNNGAARFDMPNDSTGRLNGAGSIIYGPRVVAGLKSATRQQLYLDGALDASQDQSRELFPNHSRTLAIGKHANAGYEWNGVIGEVIVYKRALSELERNQVESYLALKYGLSLGSPTAPVSYTDSQGATIWAGNALYQNNVAGIGRDDVSALDQPRSTTTIDGDLLTIAHGTLTETTPLPADRSFLVWGHNRIDITETMIGVLADQSAYTRLGRSWRIQRTGNLDPVTVMFDLTSLPASRYDPDRLALIVASSDDFADATVITTAKTIQGHMVSFQVDMLPAEGFISLIIADASELAVNLIGNGTVSSADGGIDCGSLCSAEYPSTSTVVLTATPAIHHSFSGWSGACSGSSLTCTLTMNQQRYVTATFALNQYELSVSNGGTGSGTVTSLPDIDCGALCSATFDHGSVVTLTASPETGSSFDGWSGACVGSSLTCSVTLQETSHVTATFTLDQHPLTVSTSGNGSGTVTSLPDIDCGALCSATFDHGTVVTLTATPEIGSSFDGWSGACVGSSLTCSVTLQETSHVTATFTLDQHPLTVSTSGNGSGTVTSLPEIDCGSLCSATFDYGTVVTLTASPETGSIFAGWSGACTGTTLTCEIIIDQARSVTALFTKDYAIFLPALRR